MSKHKETDLPVLVTGAAGFLGGYLVDALLSAGRPVFAVDVRSPVRDSAWRERHAGLYRFAEMDLLRGDISVLSEDHYRAVVHLASYVPKSASAPGSGEAQMVHDGVLGITLRLLDAIRGKTGQLVLASSVSVYGSRRSGTFSESDAAEPTDLYGVYKLACEGVCGCFAAANNTLLTNLRFAQIYGPGEPHGIFLQSILIGNGAENKSVALIRGGRDERDFLWVGDAAAAVVAVLDKGSCGTFNITSGKGISLRCMTDNIRSCTGGNFPLEIIDHGEPALIQNYDISSARSAFGYSPSVDIREGIRRLCTR